MISPKYLSLSILVLQTSAMVLLLRYSVTVPQAGPRYLASTTIVISEILKLSCCLLILLHNCNWSVPCLIKELYEEIWQKWRNTMKLLLPAILFIIQNNMLFLALRLLDAATYQVTYQLKILTTAIFSVMLLNKKLATIQWLALLLLMIGVTLVEMPTSDSSSDHGDQNISSRFLGVFVVLIACFTSGFSGVYFEKLLKTSAQSLWIRNIQLTLFSIFLAFVPVIIKDFSQVMENGFFQGYYTTTWIVILLQAFGGLVVSTVIKYADNILKGFATSVSIVVSTICSYYLLADFKPSKMFFTGATIVILATMLYSFPVKKNEKYSVKVAKVPDKLSGK